MRHIALGTFVLAWFGCADADDRAPMPGVDAGTGPAVTVTCVPRNAEVLTGTPVDLLEAVVAPHGRPVFMRHATFDFGLSLTASDGRLFGEDTGRPYFTDWYLVADFPLRLFNTPQGTLTPYGDRYRGTVDLDMSGWTEDPLTEPTPVRLHAVVADTEEGWHTLALGDYTTELTSLTFAYGDTGEMVPESLVEFVGCDNAGDFRTLVRAAFADVRAYTVVDYTVWDASVVRGQAELHPSLGISFKNDGAQAGTVEQFTLEAHTRYIADPAAGRWDLVGSEPYVRSCTLFRGDVPFMTSERRGDTFVFRELGITVPAQYTDNDIVVELRCTYDGSTLGPGEQALIAFSAPRDRFFLEETPPARITGSLHLEENHLWAPDIGYPSVRLLPE